MQEEFEKYHIPSRMIPDDKSKNVMMLIIRLVENLYKNQQITMAPLEVVRDVVQIHEEKYCISTGNCLSMGKLFTNNKYSIINTLVELSRRHRLPSKIKIYNFLKEQTNYFGYHERLDNIMKRFDFYHVGPYKNIASLKELGRQKFFIPSQYTGEADKNISLYYFEFFAKLQAHIYSHNFDNLLVITSKNPLPS